MCNVCVGSFFAVPVPSLQAHIAPWPNQTCGLVFVPGNPASAAGRSVAFYFKEFT